MSKRSRRYRNPNLPQEAFNSPVAAPGAASAAPSATTVSGGSVAAATHSRRVNWQEEYSEVLGDLRKTAIIAVVLVAVMVALSFVIR